MRGRSYTKLRETTFDLYTENERLPWYFKFLSILSAWLVLAGYVLFSIAYSSPADDLRISPGLTTGLASTGIVVGYLSIAALAFLSRSLIFTFDGVLLPVLTASAVGLFSTIIHRALKKTTEPGNSIYLFLPLGAACITTVIAAVLSSLTYRKLRKIKDLDARRRSHVPLESPGLPQNISREVRDMVPDDEAQRRQLLSLLMAKQDKNRHPSMEDSSATYRIDLPGEEASRQRSSSLGPGDASASRGRFHISISRDRSGTTESFRDPREIRRQQIERGGLLAANGNGNGQTPAWHGQMSSPRYG